VFRGPNTASYGANALTGVVNIITRRPEDSLGGRVTYTHGQRGIRDGYAGYGVAWNGGALRASVSSREDTGFDHRRNGSPFHDDIALRRFNLRVSHDLNPAQRLDWQLAVADGTHQDRNHHWPTLEVDLQPGERDELTERQHRSYSGSLRWDWDISPEHSLQVQSSLQHWERIWEWRTCDASILFSPELRALYRDDPQYTLQLMNALVESQYPLPDGTPEQNRLRNILVGQISSHLGSEPGTFAHTCGDVNENTRETRFDLEVQNTLSLADSLRLVSVLHYRHDHADSEAYFSGSRHKDIGRLHGQLEWYPHPQWLLQAGAMYEYDSMLGDDDLSPRLAINYLPTPAHGFRAVYTRAVRTPDMLELSADWQVYVRNLQPQPFGLRDAYFFLSNRVDGSLTQERMESHELGYNGHFTRLGLHVDVRLFRERISNLITYWAKIADLTPSNANSMEFRGWEAEANWRLGTRDRLRLSYSQVELTASHRYDNWDTPRYGGSASWLRDWGQGLSSGLSYLRTDLHTDKSDYLFERVDLSLTQRVQVSPSTNLLLHGVWQQRLDNDPLFASANNYSQKHVYWLSAGVEF